ncbi:Copia protein, partial [Mucuna pruriens]
MELLCDNNSAISIAHNPVQHDKTKHIDIDKHFIKEKLDSGLIVTTHVLTVLQVADVFTKGLLGRSLTLRDPKDDPSPTHSHTHILSKVLTPPLHLKCPLPSEVLASHGHSLGLRRLLWSFSFLTLCRGNSHSK